LIDLNFTFRARRRHGSDQRSREIIGRAMLGAIGKLRACLVGLALAGSLSVVSPANASVLVEIEKSTQTMYVTVNGVTRHQWPVSTGRGRFGTPSGVFRPQRLERRWYSRRYYNAPMPYSVFFHKGYAIHGTTELHRLGGPASHGCVRLHPRNAAILFSLVQGFGPGRTRIAIFR
jgi:lipoprotein-anchoring transpeptidase ErfK/SrfK